MGALFRLCLVAFAAGLGVVVALKLGTEAMAVVVGVLMGIFSSLPVAILILYATRRKPPEAEPADETRAWQAGPAIPAAPPQAPTMPQIVVLSAPNAPAYRPAPPYWEMPGAPAPAPREFHVVGDDE